VLTIIAMIAPSEGESQLAAIASTFGVNWSHLIAQIVSFSILCAVLYRFAYRPVLTMLNARREQIAQGLANTERINAALADIEAERQRVIADARQQGAQAVAEARALAKRVQEQELQRTAASAAQIMSDAREAARLEHDRMLAELRQDVGRLVVRTTAAVIGRVVTPDDQRRLAEDAAQYLKAS
jgi:F-type H+-transporting ATPase subunit b